MYIFLHLDLKFLHLKCNHGEIDLDLDFTFKIYIVRFERSDCIDTIAIRFPAH